MRIAFAVCCVALLGAGCGFSSASSRTPRASGIPVLRIERPSSGSATTSASVTVTGRSDVQEVQVDGQRHTVIDGIFDAPVNLVVGQNAIPIVAGNGLATTSQMLQIERLPSP